MELALRGVDVLASAPGPVQSGFAARRHALWRSGEARGGGSGDSRCPRVQNDGSARFALENFDLLPNPAAAFQPRPNDGLGNARHDESPP